MASKSSKGSSSRNTVIEAGIVKAVPSGSTVQVLRISAADKGSSRGPTEYEISLQGIRAPLGGAGKDRVEEAWYFQSREFLRNKLIGAQVAFNITHSGDGTRRFGHIFTLDGEDIRETIVSHGWAEVKPQPAGEKNEHRIKTHNKLLELQQAAKDGHKGMWASKGKGIRQLITKFDSVELFDKIKGRTTQAIVEQVRSGSTLKVYIPSTGHVLPLLLSGVQSPMFKQHNNDEQQAPWARAARFFTELQVLHRDVEIVLDSLDKANNVYGTVTIAGSNLSVKLLENGLARFVEWNATKSTVEVLKKAEKTAASANLRLFAASSAKAVASSSNAPIAPTKRVEFWGTVTDIVNGGTIQVQEFKDGMKGALLGDEVRVTLSSIQAARLIPREKLKKEKEVPKSEILAAYAARNMMRKKLMGQKVRCILDYTREASKDRQIPERSFYTVYADKKNLAIDLVSSGYATVSEHKESDPRSPDYQDLVYAEAKAKKANLGIFTKGNVEIPPFNDLSDKESLGKEHKNADPKVQKDSLDAAQVARLNQHLPLVQGSRIPVVVERVFTPTRFKVWVEKHQSMLPVVLACVRGEKLEPTPGTVPAIYPSSKCVGNLSFNFVRSLIYLRDVEIQIDGVDRTGCFTCTLFYNNKELTGQLIQEGYVKLIHAAAKRTKGFPYDEYKKLEDNAKAARRGVWLTWDEAEEERRIQALRAKKDQEAGPSDKKTKFEAFNVRITEIIDCTLFYYRSEVEADQPVFNKITDALQSSNTPLTNISEGDVVSAQFSSDNTWYRARIEKVESNDSYNVYYLDYGNSEVVPKSALRALPADCSLDVLPAQAVQARLAYLRCEALGEEHGPESADLFKHLVWDKPIIASVHYVENGIAHVVLGDPETSMDVNGELLRQGFARVIRTKHRSPIVAKMREFEESARKSYSGVWQHGDYGSDDE